MASRSSVEFRRRGTLDASCRHASRAHRSDITVRRVLTHASMAFVVASIIVPASCARGVPRDNSASSTTAAQLDVPIPSVGTLIVPEACITTNKTRDENGRQPGFHLVEVQGVSDDHDDVVPVIVLSRSDGQTFALEKSLNTSRMTDRSRYLICDEQHPRGAELADEPADAVDGSWTADNARRKVEIERPHRAPAWPAVTRNGSVSP